MRILAFSDLHCDVAAAQRIARLAAEADVLVGAGDFANARQGLHVCLDVLRQVTQPIVLVAGNNETHDELSRACSSWTSAHVLHGSSVTIAGITYFGLGGGVPMTPFGSWSFDLTEDAAAALLAPCPIGAVLVSHSPPKGCCDLSSRGQSLGSRAVLETVKRCQPELVICGHIHGSAGQRQTLRTSPVINAGPAGMITQVTGVPAEVQPEPSDLLHGLLRYFAHPASDQLRLMEEYEEAAKKEAGRAPHVYNPRAELAESFRGFLHHIESDAEIYDGFPKPLQPIIERIDAVVQSMFETSDPEATGKNVIFASSQWEEVRRLSNQALRMLSAPREQFGVHELLCYLAD